MLYIIIIIKDYIGSGKPRQGLSCHTNTIYILILYIRIHKIPNERPTLLFCFYLAFATPQANGIDNSQGNSIYIFEHLSETIYKQVFPAKNKSNYFVTVESIFRHRRHSAEGWRRMRASTKRKTIIQELFLAYRKQITVLVWRIHKFVLKLELYYGQRAIYFNNYLLKILVQSLCVESIHRGL